MISKEEALLPNSWESRPCLVLPIHIKHSTLCCKFSGKNSHFSFFFTIERGLYTVSSFGIPVFLFRRELFENLDSGASQDTVKVLLLITDGDPSDSDRKGTIEKYEIKNITRFVIAVSWFFSLCLIYINYLSPTIMPHYIITTSLLLTKS